MERKHIVWVLMVAGLSSGLSAGLSAAPAAWAVDDQSVLDKALNDGTPQPADKPADKTADKPADAAATPAAGAQPKTENPPSTGGVVDPDAAKAVDSDDLVKKLTGEDSNAQGPEKMLDEVVERMRDSAKSLHDKDAGPVTQETQRRIVVNLDALIELVKKQSNATSSQQQQQQPGQQRQPGQGNGQGPHNPGGSNAAQQSTLPGGGSDTPSSNGQDISERGKEWGNLPDRDRDLIVNGVKEAALPAYREAVQRYYKALADLNRGPQDNR